jgi:hypothetical protein
MKRRFIQKFPRVVACHFHPGNVVRLSCRPLSTANNHNNIASTATKSPTSLELDFFGEPVTFVHATLDSTQQLTNTTTNAMEALDGFLLTVVSKGKSCIGGGDEAGIDVKPAHAASLSWAELLRHAAVWNDSTTATQRSSPMLAVVAVAPLLAQAGVAYVRHLDTLLKQASPGVKGLPVIQMMDLATAVVETWMEHSDEALPWNERECLHVQALSYLLKDQHRRALSVVLKILQLCPGDLLALTLAMDLAQTTGDKRAALR